MDLSAAGTYNWGSVIIPEPICNFLRNATLAVAGTRDQNLVPHVHRPSGWSVEGDGGTMVCLFPEAFREHLESALESNGEFAITISQSPSHESYQFKGHCLEWGPIREEDMDVFRSRVESAVEQLSGAYGFPEDALRRNAPPPVLRVRFQVREIFDQTPGPGAGRRVAPLESEGQR